MIESSLVVRDFVREYFLIRLDEMCPSDEEVNMLALGIQGLLDGFNMARLRERAKEDQSCLRRTTPAAPE